MIACWLCNGLCHYKCSGLSALVAESASKNNNNGLQWCCIGCRKINVTFYRFFQGTITNFLVIQNEANKLSDRISNFGKLFEEYKSLDSVKSPAQSSPKRRKSSRKTNKGKPDDQQTESHVQQTLNPDNATISANSINLVNSASTSSQLMSNQLCVTPHNNQTFTNFTNKLNYAEVVMNKVTGALNASSNVPNLSNSDVNTNRTNTFLSPLPVQNNNFPNNTAANPSGGNPLRAVAPKRAIFISRLVNGTSSDDIVFYIKSKVGQHVDVSVYKYQFSQPRSISSFKITVADDIFQYVFDSNFWPENTLVREYVYKERQGTRNVAILPQREHNVSKN